MRKIYTFLVAVSIFVLNSSCGSSDGGGGSSSSELPTLTTLPASDVTATSAMLSLNITDDGGSQITLKGVCWGTSNNPVMQADNFVAESGGQIGTVSLFAENQFTPNTLYHARAFAENSEGIQYGNAVTFTTLELITTKEPVEILTTKAILRGEISQSSIAGFVYDTQPNPTISDESEWINVPEPSEYEIEIEGLTQNTIYYVRSYAPNGSGGYIYGNEMQFRTTGYFGSAGGYVAYDKGIETDGWRYLEIHPTTLSYNISQTSGSEWGGYGTFVSNTLDQIGSGVNNTQVIVNAVTAQNCAAKLCQNLTLGGFSDWFLPSSEEALLITNSLSAVGIGDWDYSWTSTQASATHAKRLLYESSPSPHYVIFNSPKSFPNVRVYPVRRY